MVDESRRSAKEAEQAAGRVEALEAVEQTGDDVMSARCLTAGEYHADIDCRIVNFLALLKSDKRHSVGIGKQLFYCLLVGHGLCGSAKVEGYVAAESLRHFGLVGGTSDLQWTFNHDFI